MSNAGLERNGIYIGSMKLPNRAKPSFVVQRGNEAIVLGSFRNEEMVDEFEKALCEMLEVGGMNDTD